MGRLQQWSRPKVYNAPMTELAYHQPMKKLAECFFDFKVGLTKAVLVAIILPCAAAVIVAGLPFRRYRFRDLTDLFSITEWKTIFSNHVEAMWACRWYVSGTKTRPIDLPRYCYWDNDTRLICCLHLDDAVFLNMKYGGTLTKTPDKDANNAPRASTR